MIVNRLQSMRRARRRFASVTFYAQTFQKPARYFCYCPTGLSRGTGWGAPLRGVFVVCATLERLCDCVLACCALRAWARSYDRGYIVAVVASWVIARRGRVVAVSCPSRCGRVSVRPWPWWPLCGGVAWLLWPWLQAVALAVVATSLFCVAVVWLRHADEYQCLQRF